MVDADWINNIRAQNQAAFGMSGLGAQDIVTAQRGEREYRTRSIHAGRFEQRDPNKPTEGSIESIAQAIGPVPVAAAPAPPRGMNILVLGAIAGMIGFIGWSLWRKK